MTRAATRLVRSEYIVLVLFAVYFLAMVVAAPGFATSRNFAAMFSAMLPLLVAATGQTLVMIVAGIDLSVTAVVALAGVSGALVMTGASGEALGPESAPVGMLVMVGVGAGIGLVNGGLITGLRMPAYIVTLITMMFVDGFAVRLSHGVSIPGLPEGFLVLGRSALCGVMIAGGIAVAAHLLLARTLPGQWLYAVGHNPRTARLSGVPVARTTILAYVLCGLCAGVAAILIAGHLGAVSPMHWRSYLLDIIGATIIGGTSLSGGKGKVVWTLFGVLLLTLIDNSLNLLGLSPSTIMMFKGMVVLLAAVLDALRNRSLPT